MDVILATFALFALAAAWTYLPFIPAVRELREKKDVKPVQVTQDLEIDIRYFASRYRRYIEEHLAEPLMRSRQEGRHQEGRLEDGTPYLLIAGDGVHDQVGFDRLADRSDSMILSCEMLSLPPGSTYMRELYAAGSVRGGKGNLYRAVLADGSIDFAAQSSSLRWIHAGDVVRVAEDSQLWGRVSADDRIELAAGCRFERMSAPEIVFGSKLESRPESIERDLLRSQDLRNVVDMAGGRWLINRQVVLPPEKRVEANLVITGRARVGHGAKIDGSIKTHKNLILGRGVEVDGSVVSERDIHLKEGCHIHGPVLAEGTVFIDHGCVIGSAEHPTTVNARRIQIDPGVVVHGTVWAHREGHLTSGKRREK